MSDGTATTTELDVRLEKHRVELTGYCYRMLGSSFEAEDAVQDTMVRAWRSYDKFEGRSSAAVVAVPHRDERLPGHADRGQQAGPAHGPHGLDAAGPGRPLTPARTTPGWSRCRTPGCCRPAADPAEAAVAKESVRLAFVAALQQLPAEAAGGADPARGAGVEGERGRRAARHVGGVGEQRPAAGPRDARRGRAGARRRGRRPAGRGAAEAARAAMWRRSRGTT